MQRLNLTRQLTTLGDCRVHSLHAGAGPPVILLHGLAGSSGWWRYSMPALAARFSTHAPDLVGFGRSHGALRRSIADTAQLIVAWLHARGIERPHIIGHSMGGQIAIHLAAEHPDSVQRLVLVGAAGIPRPISLTQAVRFAAEVLPPRAWGTPRFLPRVAVDTLRAGPRSMARSLASIIQDDVRPLLPRVAAPTLLIWGALDPLTPLRDGELMAARIPHAELRVFANSAHMPMVDEAERFCTEVIGFLAQ